MRNLYVLSEGAMKTILHAIAGHMLRRNARPLPVEPVAMDNDTELMVRALEAGQRATMRPMPTCKGNER